MKRILVSIASSAAAVALLALAPASGQTPAAKAKPAPKAYVPPKTPWGDPDIQGIWPGNVGVPMQRPAAMGTRTTLTDEEFAGRVKQAQTASAADRVERAKGDERVGIGPPSYWTERGKPTRQTSLIVDPPDGRLPAKVPNADQLFKSARGGKGMPGEWRGEAAAPDDMNIYYRCVTRGVLGCMIPVVYNNGNQIVQSPGYVVLRNEMIHEARVIPLNNSPHMPAHVKSYMGDSRGHWEGNTLVIETTNFNAMTAIGSNGAGYPGDPGYHSQDMKLIEKITRVDDVTLNYEATVNDPKVWTKPYTLLIQLKSDPEYQFLEYACHEGNYAMGDILSGARAEEQAKAKK